MGVSSPETRCDPWSGRAASPSPATLRRFALPRSRLRPVCEYLEDHSHCFEMMFLFSDDGAGSTFFIPKSPGTDADLLALCRTLGRAPRLKSLPSL